VKPQEMSLLLVNFNLVEYLESKMNGKQVD
jgi:hypothetical protein